MAKYGAVININGNNMAATMKWRQLMASASASYENINGKIKAKERSVK